MTQLTATQIKNLKATEKDYRLHDGNGLYLLVRKTGKKTFLHRVRKPKDTFHKIGNYPAVSLAEARAYVSDKIKRKDQEDSLIAVIDDTFVDVAEKWFNEEKDSWSESYANRVRLMIDRDIYARIKNKKIARVTSKDVYLIMNDLSEQDKKHVANKVKSIIHSIFKYAIRNLRCESDPTLAVDTIKTKKTQHSVALKHHELTRLFQEYENSKAKRVTILANRFLALTMMRTIELCETKWNDIDFKENIIMIGGDRMKKEIPHVVPLSTQALDVLEEMKQYSSNSEYVFPNALDNSKPMRTKTVYSSITKYRKWLTDLSFGPHGYRATASTMLNQKGFRSDIIEKQLAHSTKDKVRGSYNHADYLDERRKMLQSWGDYIENILNEVVE
ncbi:tyrosine-type recombinase/integrase [Halomonas sp. ISL-60]|uniref:tyrosine-type recombinase/integrase n=1 Tax=Halomonas sp. ISL-56 TaxID=2819149 RepID=UPI001BE89F3A|nr:tyrosine-type recombinase/integrase [Halomonas sp. ISL-56]MBT2771345.1 tyrosine-type recombinase/integrase [Halomonas sp. ISL-60]MBT2800702.1 tyrosine-type recombinase/integrase [Halomonas sp. ISL-56]